MSGAGWPGTAIGTLTPGDIKPANQFQVYCKNYPLLAYRENESEWEV